MEPRLIMAIALIVGTSTGTLIALAVLLPRRRRDRLRRRGVKTNGH